MTKNDRVTLASLARATGVSRQRYWQMVHELRGLCKMCSKPEDAPASRVCAHHRKTRARGGQK